MKPMIFISHISAESNVAVWIKDTISELLFNDIEFFVSSDRNAIKGGDKWLDKIESSLQDSSVVLVLCSKSSIHRPWVNFEAGGAWMAGKRVIPICHGDLDVSNLPAPLSSLQGYELSKHRDFQDLVSLIAQQAGLKPPKVAPGILATLPVVSSPVDVIEMLPLHQAVTSPRVDKIDIHDVGTLRSNYKFEKRTGIYRHMKTDEPVCTSCIIEEIVSPLTEAEEGWYCQRRVCNKFYRNPNFCPPGTADMDYNPFD